MSPQNPAGLGVLDYQPQPPFRLLTTTPLLEAQPLSLSWTYNPNPQVKILERKYFSFKCKTFNDSQFWCTPPSRQAVAAWRGHPPSRTENYSDFIAPTVGTSDQPPLPGTARYFTGEGISPVFHRHRNSTIKGV